MEEDAELEVELPVLLRGDPNVGAPSGWPLFEPPVVLAGGLVLILFCESSLSNPPFEREENEGVRVVEGTRGRDET